MDKKMLCDSYCKRVLSNRGVLAIVVKYGTYQFADEKLDTIKNSIESNVETSMNDERITVLGMNNEFNAVDEGKSIFDVLTYINDSNNKVCAIINIEAQNKSKPGHDTISRAVFYDSRLKSMQYGKFFKSPDYDELVPVYTIWIHLNPSKENAGKIKHIHFQMDEEHVKDKKYYDKSNIIMVYLGQNSDYQFIRDLDMLFKSKELSAKEKATYFKEHYDVDFGDEFEREVEKMCNFSEGFVEIGMERGMEKGIILGREQGLQQGIVEGIQRGKQDKLLAITKMINSLNLNPEAVYELLGLDEAEREEYTKLLHNH